jgi:hypothetical protein
MADEALKAGSPAALPPIAVDVKPVTSNIVPANPAGTESAPLPVTLGAGAGNPAQE